MNNCCDYGCDQSPKAFAPGTIDGPYRRQRRRLLSAAQVEAIGRAVLFMAVLAALVGTLGFIAGYINAGGLL